MYVVELSFTGDQSRRLAERPAHRERLNALHERGKAPIAGPWEDGSGAMVVFAVDDDAALKELMDADPYYRTPGVTVTAVRRLQPVVPTPEEA